MMPQAMRAPELPPGSVSMSSGPAWIMIEVPPLARMEFGAAGSREMLLTVKEDFSVPSELTLILRGMSPSWGPSGFFVPCIFPVGLKWGPEVAYGGSHSGC